MITIEDLLSEDEYSWCEDQTENMTQEEIRAFLFAEAESLKANEEWDVVYEIYRELVYKFNDELDAWVGLLQAAEELRNKNVADIALMKIEALSTN